MSFLSNTFQEAWKILWAPGLPRQILILLMAVSFMKGLSELALIPSPLYFDSLKEAVQTGQGGAFAALVASCLLLFCLLLFLS